MFCVADTIRAAFLTGYAELARSVGLDPLRMLDAAGIPRAALTDPDLRFPTTAARDLLEASARGAEDFGLRLIDQRTPSIMGPVALIARVVAAAHDLHVLLRHRSRSISRWRGKR